MRPWGAQLLESPGSRRRPRIASLQRLDTSRGKRLVPTNVGIETFLKWIILIMITAICPIIVGCLCDLWWDIPVTYNLTVNVVAVNTMRLPLSVDATCGRELGWKGTEFGRQVNLETYL